MYLFGIIVLTLCFIISTYFVKAFYRIFVKTIGAYPELDRAIRLCCSGFLLSISTLIQSVSLLIVLRYGLIRIFSMNVPLPPRIIVLYSLVVILVVLFSAYRKGRRTTSSI